MKKISQEEVILQKMKKVFEKCDFPVRLERSGGRWNISCGLMHPEGNYKEIVLASYSPKMHFTTINSMLVSPPISQDKVADVLDLLNAINQSLVPAFLRFRPDMKALDVRAGMFLASAKFDSAQFKRLLDHVIDVGHKFYPILQDFLGGNTSKDDALQLIDKAWPRPETETE